MIVQCPNCSHCVKQEKNRSGPNFCPSCRNLFEVPPPEPIKSWVWGVIVVMVVLMQMNANLVT